MEILSGKNLQLRAPEPEDLDYLYQWENDPEIWQVSNTLAPFSRFTMKSYIESANLDIYAAKQLRLMIDLKGLTPLTIGTIDLFDFDPYHNRAGIGILIGDKKNRRQGFAEESLGLLINYCFQVLFLHQLYCNISSNNMASISLFQKKGFVKTGEKKDWLKTINGWENEDLYQLIRID